MAKVKSLDDINNLSYKEFGDYFANVVEKTPLIPLAAWSERPFCSVRDLHATLCKFLDHLPFQGKSQSFSYKNLVGEEKRGGGSGLTFTELTVHTVH